MRQEKSLMCHKLGVISVWLRDRFYVEKQLTVTNGGKLGLYPNDLTIQ